MSSHKFSAHDVPSIDVLNPVDHQNNLKISENSPVKNGKSPFVSFLIQFLVIAVAFFAIGFAIGQKKIEIERKSFIPKINVVNQFPPENQNLDFSLFWDVFNTLPEKYIDKTAINSQELLYGAISGMVKSLGDPYTAFVDPRQNELIRSELSGSYEGIGIQIGFNEEKRLAVIAPLKGTPAESADVLAKDVISKIDGESTIDITLPQAVEKIRGPEGSTVKLELIREGENEPFEVEIGRAKIDIKTVDVEYRQVDGREIAIVRVSRFGEKTDSEWDEAIDAVVTKDTDAVVVDMRNNPGGFLSGAVHLSGDFIRGTVVKQEFADGSTQSLPTNGKSRLLKMPLVVLVNGGSASASEIFAGAIQDARRGEIIGEQTFGKGSVQDVVDLPGGSGLHVTVARWLTPKGNSIQGVGITPDIIIEISREDREAGRDPQLEKALEQI